MAKNQRLPEYSYARRRGQPAVDPALRRIAIMAGVVSIVVIVVALAWSGLRPHLGFGGAIPVISAPATPLRVVPPSPGGLTVPGANEQIMSGQASVAAPTLAAPPPPPDLGQLQREAAVPKPAPPAPQSVAPTPSVPPPAVMAPAPIMATAAPAVTAASVAVQLAATGTEAAAHAAWYALLRAQPALLAGRKPVFIPVTVNGKAVVRLRVPGFADRPTAAAFCAALVAKGAACTVASL